MQSKTEAIFKVQIKTYSDFVYLVAQTHLVNYESLRYFINSEQAKFSCYEPVSILETLGKGF
jgi:hypothetical protein